MCEALLLVFRKDNFNIKISERGNSEVNHIENKIKKNNKNTTTPPQPQLNPM